MVLKQRWYQPRAFARSEMATGTAERRQQGPYRDYRRPVPGPAEDRGRCQALQG